MTGVYQVMSNYQPEGGSAMEKEQARGERNRLRIIEAADQLFYQKGYNTTSFTDISEAAQVPRGNFYYYFKTKDEILSSVIDSRVDGLREMLKNFDQSIHEPRERLKAFAGILTKREGEIIRYGCRFGTLNAELGKTQIGMQAKASGLFDVFLGWLITQFESLGHAKEARMQALHLLACFQGTTLLAYAYKDHDFIMYEVERINAWIDSL